MRILLIDRDAAFRQQLSRLIAVDLPEARVEHYDPAANGRPGPAFALSEFDLVFLGYRLGPEDGLEWLREFRMRPGCPPAVVLADAGDERAAVRAMKMGAYDYLPKTLVNRESLGQIMTQVLGERTVPAPPAPGKAPGTSPGKAPEKSPDKTLELRSLEPLPGAAAEPPNIQGYKLLREVGRGAVSRVYLMTPEAGGSPVIAKVLFENLVHDSDFLQRFLREYQIVGRIRSRYVGQVYSYGFSDNSAYILMEYLSGGDVRTYYTGNYVDQGRILSIFRQVLMALRDIHAAGVIHRDLKPHNVMFRSDLSLAMVDFGIAKVIDDPGITMHGVLLGTPVYMSPEVIRGCQADARSDLYSAGVMLYQMIAKAAPFTGETADEIIDQHLNAPPPLLPRAQDEFQPLIDTLLAKDPGGRPASADAALKLIDHLFFG